MKLFERSGGYWLFWCSAIYLVIGLYCALYYKEIPTVAIQLPWLLAISAPLTIPPLGRWLNMNVTWDKDMFDMFGKKNYDTKGTTTTEGGYVLPEVKVPEKPPVTYYTIGLTSENRVELKIGYSTITMNKTGVEQLINQLEVFHDSLNDEPVEATNEDASETE